MRMVVCLDFVRFVELDIAEGRGEVALKALRYCGGGSARLEYVGFTYSQRQLILYVLQCRVDSMCVSAPRTKQ